MKIKETKTIAFTPAEVEQIVKDWVVANPAIYPKKTQTITFKFDLDITYENGDIGTARFRGATMELGL
jgi:hypothetical protein